jgi:sigma-E factor negative regulatory protein RseB
VVEQMMFTSLDYLEQAPPQKSLDLKPFEAYEQHLLDEPEVDVSDSAPSEWVINTLPKGFMLTQSTMRYSQSLLSKRFPAENIEQQPDLLHMVYSDGLASVSVFIEKRQDAEKHLQGPAKMGVVNAFGNTVGEYFVTVVGEVPEKTVQAMAQSALKVK